MTAPRLHTLGEALMPCGVCGYSGAISSRSLYRCHTAISVCVDWKWPRYTREYPQPSLILLCFFGRAAGILRVSAGF